MISLKYIIKNNNTIERSTILTTTFIISLLFGVIVYGFELTHFTLSIDEAISPEYDYTFFNAIGRWMFVFLKTYILPNPYVPFFTTFLSLIFLALTSVIIVQSFRFNLIQAIIFSAFFIGLPQFAYQLEFNTQSDAVSLGLILACISFYCFITRTKNHLVLSYIICIVCITLATAIYQSLLFVPITLYIAKLIYDINTPNIQLKKIIRDCFIFFLLVIIATILYFTITKIVISLNNITINSYTQNFVNKDTLNNFSILYLIKQFLTKMSLAYGLNPYFLSFIPIVWFTYITISKFDYKKIIILALSILLFVSPFFICIILGKPQPARILLSLPIAMGLLFALCTEKTKFNKPILCLSVFIVLIGSASANRLFYSDHITYETDKALANRIYYSIQDKYPTFSPAVTAVYFRTPYYYTNFWKLENSETFGASHFNWDGAQSSGRVIQIFKVTNIANMHMPSINIREKLDEICLPSWPNKESIQMIDGVLVVNLRKDLVRKPNQICNAP